MDMYGSCFPIIIRVNMFILGEALFMLNSILVLVRVFVLS